MIGHRGASAYAPENTIVSFELARKLGADWFELDCRLSKDDQVVVIHDSTVDRTTNGTGAVNALTVEELKQLDAGSWLDEEFAGEPIPTLSEALEVGRKRIGVYIEIKSDADDSALVDQMYNHSIDAANGPPQYLCDVMGMIEASGTRNLLLTRKVIELVEAKAMQKRVVIQSFSPVVCAIVKAEAPDIRCEFLGGDSKDDPGKWDRFLQLGYALDVDGFNVSHGSITRARVDEFHAAGKSVGVYTVNEIADMRRLVALGVDNIISDKPQLALAADKQKHRDPLTYE